MARGGRRAQPIIVDSVSFQPSQAGSVVGARKWLRALYMLAFAIWSIAAGWHRYPWLGVVAALFYLEFGLAGLRLATLTGSTVFSDELSQRIAPPVVELCAKAGCAQPRVVIRDDAVRAASVRAGRGGARLVVSQQFAASVDDRQLRALLAHEVVHVARGDLKWAWARLVLSMVLAGAGTLALAAIVPGLAYPIAVASFALAAFLSQVLLAFFNRNLERRADSEGAQLAADPAGLAGALRMAQRFTDDARATIYGSGPWKWLLWPLSWRLPTHPPMEERIAGLAPH